jgi:hypothetical protein
LEEIIPNFSASDDISLYLPLQWKYEPHKELLEVKEEEVDIAEEAQSVVSELRRLSVAEESFESLALNESRKSSASQHSSDSSLEEESGDHESSEDEDREEVNVNIPPLTFSQIYKQNMNSNAMVFEDDVEETFEFPQSVQHLYNKNMSTAHNNMTHNLFTSMNIPQHEASAFFDLVHHLEQRQYFFTENELLLYPTLNDPESLEKNEGGPEQQINTIIENIRSQIGNMSALQCKLGVQYALLNRYEHALAQFELALKLGIGIITHFK